MYQHLQNMHIPIEKSTQIEDFQKFPLRVLPKKKGIGAKSTRDVLINHNIIKISFKFVCTRRITGKDQGYSKV